MLMKSRCIMTVDICHQVRIFSFYINYREPSVERLLCSMTKVELMTFYIGHMFKTQNSWHGWKLIRDIWKQSFWLIVSFLCILFGRILSINGPHEKRGFTIGRLHFVPLASGEIFYLRMLLNYVKGPESYAQIRTVNNIEYLTF